MAIPGSNIGHALANTLSPTMRQRRVAGAKTFVDFAGDTLPIYGPDDEVAFYAQIFVAVLGAVQTDTTTLSVFRPLNRSAWSIWRSESLLTLAADPPARART